MMDWDHLLSTLRFGQEHLSGLRPHARTEFQRDYDRLIFSSAFRRMQSKTQVFPLPGIVFVHNRLTHSLEVSCVGRSLANNAATAFIEKYKGEEWTWKLESLDDVVATACLAHDMGNPPFGHSGERAISSYFAEGNGKSLESELDEQQWMDLVHFEGNANAFRLLSHQFNGRRAGGFALTYTTLASVIKYPYPSTAAGKKGKFGYFQAESDGFHRLMKELRIEPADTEGKCFSRHPLVFLVEAADDICYQIMDIEDAHHLKILSTDETRELLLGFLDGERRTHVEDRMNLFASDVNEQIAYLRSCAIGTLVHECSEAFISHEEEILRGRFMTPLMDLIPETPKQAYRRCSEVAVSKIYNTSDVVDIEIAGHRIFSVLLDRYLEAVLWPDRVASRLLLSRVPRQYEMRSPELYCRVLAVLDYISGMTDEYALDLYRKINGISLPTL